MAKPNSGIWRRVSVKIWRDNAFRALSEQGKLIYLFVITHPNMTNIGAMSATIEGLAAELRMDFSRCEPAFFEAVESGMLDWDSEEFVIAIPNHFKHDPPENPNVVTSMIRTANHLPDSEIIDAQMIRLLDFMEAHSADFGGNFTKPFHTHSSLLSDPILDRLGMPKKKPNVARKSNPNERVSGTLSQTLTDTVPKGYRKPFANTGAGAGAGDLKPNNKSNSNLDYIGDANQVIAPLSLDRIGDLSSIPKKPHVAASQGFHALDDPEIIAWIVHLEPEMQGRANRLEIYKKLSRIWIKKLNSVWTKNGGRVAIIDLLADIWNSQNAGNEKGVGTMTNPAAWLNKKVTLLSRSVR